MGVGVGINLLDAHKKVGPLFVHRLDKYSMGAAFVSVIHTVSREPNPHAILPNLYLSLIVKRN